MDKGIQKIADKYICECIKCQNKFYPWETLMVTLPQNDMKPYVYCPNCKHYDSLENFRIN